MKYATITWVGLLLTWGSVACIPKPVSRPMARRLAQRPAKTLALSLVRHAYAISEKGGCDGQLYGIDRVTLLPGRGVVSREFIGCGRLGLEGGRATYKDLGTFAVLVKPAKGQRPPPKHQKFLDEWELSYDYGFWGPTGKPFHKVENTNRLLSISIASHRWLSYVCTRQGVSLGLVIVDTRTGETKKLHGRVVSNILTRKGQLLFELIPERAPGGSGHTSDSGLWCLDLPSMKAHHLTGLLPQFDEEWEEAVKWSPDGKIVVNGRITVSQRRFRKVLTCPGAGAR